ncbi:MAG: hypothetical protein ACI35W_02600 [Anaeroplasmataceae bacterium]
MICMLCNKSFLIKRRIKDLLVKQKYLVCDNCYKAHPLTIDNIVLPLNNNKNGYIISLFNESEVIDFSGFMFEYSIIASKYIDKYLILYDTLNLTDKTIDIFNILSNLVDDDLYIITNRCRLL